MLRKKSFFHTIQSSIIKCRKRLKKRAPHNDFINIIIVYSVYYEFMIIYRFKVIAL